MVRGRQNGALFAAALVSALAVAGAHGATFHVATSGDAAAGSEAEPLRTIQKAVALARAGDTIEQQDPQFVDPESFDFRLQPRSPAIGAGVAESAPTTDREGTARPQGTGIDIGAYEYTQRE